MNDPTGPLRFFLAATNAVLGVGEALRTEEGELSFLDRSVADGLWDE